MTDRPLRPHQVAGLEQLRAALKAGASAPMLAAPTGAGKTRIISEIVVRALAKGKRVLITVPATELVGQTVADLEAEGVRAIGVMQANHPRTDASAPVQVASVQTLQRRKMPPCDLILIDEAHVFFAFFAEMIAEAKERDCPVIGYSATPWARGLGRHFDRLIQLTTTRDLIAAGYLAPFKVFAPAHPDLDGVRTVAGDFNEGDLADAMNKPELVADIVSTWRQRGEDRPTLAFAVDCAHARQIQEQFEAAGVRTGYIDAHTPREERARIRDRLRDGGIRVVCNVGTLTTGTDWPWVSCIILARPTRSEILFVQIVGRGLRTAPGKADCLILDHSSTHARLGFVTDIAHHALDGGEPRKALSRSDEPRPKECSECHALRSPDVAVCPACGHEEKHDIEAEAGELVSFDEIAATRVAIQKALRAGWYAQLKAIAVEREYSGGWAFHKFVERFGDRPRDVEHVRPQPPTNEVLRWVKSRQIAYARARRSA